MKQNIIEYISQKTFLLVFPNIILNKKTSDKNFIDFLIQLNTNHKILFSKKPLTIGDNYYINFQTSYVLEKKENYQKLISSLIQTTIANPFVEDKHKNALLKNIWKKNIDKQEYLLKVLETTIDTLLNFNSFVFEKEKISDYLENIKTKYTHLNITNQNTIMNKLVELSVFLNDIKYNFSKNDNEFFYKTKEKVVIDKDESSEIKKIVDNEKNFLSQESLFKYLNTKTNIKREDIILFSVLYKQLLNNNRLEVKLPIEDNFLLNMFIGKKFKQEELFSISSLLFQKLDEKDFTFINLVLNNTFLLKELLHHQIPFPHSDKEFKFIFTKNFINSVFELKDEKLTIFYIQEIVNKIKDNEIDNKIELYNELFSYLTNVMTKQKDIDKIVLHQKFNDLVLEDEVLSFFNFTLKERNDIFHKLNIDNSEIKKEDLNLVF